MKKLLFLFSILVSLLFPVNAYADVHNRPVTTSSLSPSPSTPGSGLTIYSDPVTVTLQATADTGYTVANTYYKIDGGSQQTYSSPFTVSGSGDHSIEYWSLDSSGLEEYPHESRGFIVNPQHGVINSITPNNDSLNASVNFDNFSAYTSQLYNNDCYNDGSSFELYNANTGARVSSQSGYGHCYSLGSPNQTLVFPPQQLPSGTYFIHYSGSGKEWITDNFTYTAPAPAHNQPNTTSSLSPIPSTPGNGLIIYSDPVTVTLNATADSGYSVDHTYYKIDGGSQQTYSSAFTITGTGDHSVEYWSVDNTNLEERPHKFIYFTINFLHGTIVSLTQNGTSVDTSVHLDNFSIYTSQLYNNDCYNGGGAFELYNANTGGIVSSQTGEAHCYSLGSPNQTLVFPPLQLATGTYFIHYHGGNNQWITDNYNYTAPAPVHDRPTTTSTLAPNPTTPGNGLTIYSDPVTVTLQASVPSGYTVANTYYKLDGGTQQTYSTPFTVSGSGTHSFEFWSVDNTGLEELPHKSRSFIINPQHGVINFLYQNSISIDTSVRFDNFSSWTSQLYNSDCYNGSGSFEIYNADTGAKVSSQSVEAHCYSLGSPNQTLVFPPLQLAAGNYFIHFNGGGNDWITDTYSYVPHQKPNTTISLSPSPDNQGNYSNPVTATLQASADNGFSIANTYFTIDGGSQQTYSAPFTVTEAGDHTIAYWSVDNSGLPESNNTKTFTIRVNQPPYVNPLSGGSITAGSTYTENGSFTDADSTSWTATVDYGDGAGPINLPLNSDKTFALNHQYNTAGTYTVTVVVTDNQFATGTTMTTVTVVAPTPTPTPTNTPTPTATPTPTNVPTPTPTNTPPSVGTINVSANPIQVNSSMTAGATFTDPDTSDTHIAVWTWGDGNTTNGTVIENPGSGSVLDSHTYITAGVYQVTLTVTDNHGGVGTQTFQYVSVYNPTAQGLFSAGQKYTSPSGAYPSNPSLTGTVKFGLSYKYQGTVPTGHKEFNMDFNQANLHFNATSVSSLVINNGVGTLRGTGTINGSGSYNFLITGDENANTIRIQIKDQSGSVIYDTQPGALATATPTTLVTGNVLAH